MDNNIKLFITGAMQVMFISINTSFISRDEYIGVLGSSFIVSYLWSINVKKISVSSFKERIIYSSGASLGCISGLFLSKIISGLL
jgi:hypothetical protein